MLDRDSLAGWIKRYEQAWRTDGTQPLDGLFAQDATYSPAPFEEPLRGLAAIKEFWDAEREGPDEEFEMSFEVVAIEGDTGVARLDVSYRAMGNRYLDLWVVRIGSDGRCTAFEEWPFFPGRPRIAPGDA